MGRIPKVDKEKALEDHRRMLDTPSYTATHSAGITDPLIPSASAQFRGLPKRRGPHSGRGHNATRMGHQTPPHHSTIIRGGFQAKLEPFGEYGDYGDGSFSGDNTVLQSYQPPHGGGNLREGGVTLQNWGDSNHSGHRIIPSMNFLDHHADSGHSPLNLGSSSSTWGSSAYGCGEAYSPDYGESPVGSTSLSPSEYSFFLQASSSSLATDQAAARRHGHGASIQHFPTIVPPAMDDSNLREGYTVDYTAGLSVKVSPSVPRSASLGTMGTVDPSISLSPRSSSVRREMSPFNAPVIKELISQVYGYC